MTLSNRILRLLLSLPLFCWPALSHAEEGAVAVVEGHLIHAEEFHAKLRQIEIRCPGATPLERREMAMEICVRDLVIERLAAARGLLPGIGHDARRQAFGAENARRIAANERHEVVYGPVPLRWDQFLRLRREQIELSLLKAFRRELPPIAEDLLREDYAAYRAAFVPADSQSPLTFEELRDHFRLRREQQRFAATIQAEVGAVAVTWLGQPDSS